MGTPPSRAARGGRGICWQLAVAPQAAASVQGMSEDSPRRSSRARRASERQVESEALRGVRIDLNRPSRVATIEMREVHTFTFSVCIRSQIVPCRQQFPRQRCVYCQRTQS